MAGHKRSRIIIDAKVQGAIVLRALAYWCCCFVAVAAMLVTWRLLMRGRELPLQAHLDDLWFQFGPAALASALLVPLITFDSLRLSSRIAGPVFRLRRMLRELAKGEKVPPLSFRGNDFWREIAADFNAIAARMQALSAQAESDTDEEPEASLVSHR